LVLIFIFQESSYHYSKKHCIFTARIIHPDCTN